MFQQQLIRVNSHTLEDFIFNQPFSSDNPLLLLQCNQKQILQSFGYQIILSSMNASWVRPNLYVVQNGKLVPRPTTPQQKKNYRYIHFQPLNNPAPEDYFRQTISRLQKENLTLKTELASKLEEQDSRNRLLALENKSDQVRQYETQISSLLQELASKNHELEQKNHQLTSKDKRVLELSNENTRLHLRINNVVKQIESLNLVMSKKDEQLLTKKQQIQQYCKVLEKLTQKEKQEEKTMVSEGYLNTPKIQQKADEEDEFYSIQCDSINGRRSLDLRFMTPNLQALKVDDSQRHLYRSQEQINIDERNFKSGRSSRVNSQQSYFSLSNISELALRPMMKNSLSFELLNQEIDPVAGSFSNQLSNRK